jgi:hypothetical protein
MLDAAFWSQDDTSLEEHLDAPEPSYALSMTLVHGVSCVESKRWREGVPATDAKGEMLDEKDTQVKFGAGRS